jgi:putative salt-induced outer membrane protein
MKPHLVGLSFAAAALAGPAHATALPEPIRAMIAAAAQREDPAVLQAVVSVARQATPEHAAEIDAIAATYAEPVDFTAPVEVETPLLAAAAEPDPVIWKGTFELGGSQVSGATDVVGAYGAMDLSRKSRRWTHRLNGRVDYQRTHGDPTTDRVALTYQPQFHLGPRLYAYGLSQYDHDLSLGVRTRLTAGAGLGVTASDGSELKIALDAGPAIRRTDYTVLESEESLAGRASLNIQWLATERVTVAQELATFAERGRLNTKSTTALDTRLFGPLKARLSYNLLYERDEPRQRTELETTSRATLLYSF